MPTTITGTSLTVGSIDLTTPLATADGGTGSSTISPYQMVLGTAQATTSGTSIDFTGIPSWVKRINVMLSGVSTSSTNTLQLQIGTGGSATITGYVGAVSTTGGSQNAMSTGFSINNNMTAAGLFSGIVTLTLLSGNTWVEAGTIMPASGTPIGAVSAGYLTLGGTLGYLRIIGSSTGNPADTFDAGSVNIMYEGY